MENIKIKDIYNALNNWGIELGVNINDNYDDDVDDDDKFIFKIDD